METKKNWTLKSIAQKLNVSSATVSNAFNRPDQLSKKRRNEILAACAELGYFGPNKAAQSLRKGKSNIVALVLSDNLEYMITDPVASTVITGVSSITEKHGIHLLLFAGSSDSINSVVDFVDGFICIGAPTNPQIIKELNATDKKVVTMDFAIEGCASVMIDNQQAAYEIAKRAINSANDRIAILGLRLLDIEQTCRVYNLDDVLDYTVASHRLKGYLQAATESGVEIAHDRIWNIPESTQNTAVIAAREALSSNPQPNVLLCMSDRIALAALNEANRLGLRVPEDLRIVGFDGIEESRNCSPSLTTVCQHSEEKGRLIAEFFVNDTQEGQVTPYTIQEGGSC
ncbi:LacI family DNA-binding transcriptional regulator [Paraneptunicella aestuarii]|uniref:LacI family DNA-binding transcriptional regulator n=1 Tax=Paraneptunicella aestuarii TaxID=2831148 RepID=UPI001E334477|nr:LacI family DNA-binding transcriptional regulator [Paraneptunicella aestuarii]UAA38262.1 LacI family DNA-binding transcriptional regulator [Paraneptunicella aestuarii]